MHVSLVHSLQALLRSNAGSAPKASSRMFHCPLPVLNAMPAPSIQRKARPSVWIVNLEKKAFKLELNA
jgi:hypothetical protein